MEVIERAKSAKVTILKRHKKTAYFVQKNIMLKKF